MGLQVNKPTQFELRILNDVDVFTIVDGSGKVYHFREDAGKGGTILVNIPHKGEYFANVDNEIISERKIPIPNLPALDKPNRNRFQPVTIVLDENLNDTPACIFSEIGLIVVSPMFVELPVQIQEFLIEHEKGHMLYREEESCDKFALAACLKMGNNRSMCFYALQNYLSRSPENIKRMENILDSIQETQKKIIVWT